MTKWICVSLIFMFILSPPAHSQTLDILGKNSPYSVRTSPTKVITYVRTLPATDAKTAGFLPEGSYISKIEEANGWSHIKYDYIRVDGECTLLPFYKDVRDGLAKTYQEKQKGKASDGEMRAFMHGVLRDAKLPNECFQRVEGWIESKDLISNTSDPIKNQVKTEVCTTCSARTQNGEAKGVVNSTKEIAKAIQEKTTDLNVKTGYASQPEACSLKSAVNIANDLHSDPKICKEALKNFSKKCSPWRNLDDDMETMKSVDRNGNFLALQVSTKRVAEVKKLSERAAEKLGGLNPNALRCIAFRESHYEPTALNSSACQARNLAYNTDEKLMKNWRSTAHGLSQHVQNTVDGLWPYIKNTKAEGGGTYEQNYKTPKGLHDALWYDPYLHMELMGLHLKYLATYYKTNKGQALRAQLVNAGYNGDLARVYLAYDSDQARTWVREVLDCQDCLDKGEDTVECLGKAHGVRSCSNQSARTKDECFRKPPVRIDDD